MKRTGLLIIIGIIVILGFWGCSGYNGLVKQDENVKKAWNNVQAETCFGMTVQGPECLHLGSTSNPADDPTRLRG